MNDNTKITFSVELVVTYVSGIYKHLNRVVWHIFIDKFIIYDKSNDDPNEYVFVTQNTRLMQPCSFPTRDFRDKT